MFLSYSSGPIGVSAATASCVLASSGSETRPTDQFGSEIVTYPSRDEFIDRYLEKFSNSSKTPAFDGLQFAESLYSDEHCLGLFDGDNLISLLVLMVRETRYFQVTLSQTDKKYQQRGCFRYLLFKAVDRHYTVLSDDHQTPEAEKAWKSLIRYPSEFASIGVYDVDTGTITPTTNTDPGSIWNQHPNPVLIIQRKSKSLQECMDREVDIKSKFGRDFSSIWFGSKAVD